MPVGGKPTASRLDGLLKCPSCINHVGSPIQQFPIEHKLSSNCNSRVQCDCLICQKSPGNMRYLAADKLPFSLPHIQNRLNEMNMLPCHRKLKHGSNFVARPYNCPHLGSHCPVSGDICTLVAHLRQIHGVDLQTRSSFNHHYMRIHPSPAKDSSWALTLFNCFNEYFCLHFEMLQLGTEPIYMAFLSFMGEASDAGKFSYKLEVGGNRRQLVWQGIPISIRYDYQKVRDNLDGLIVLGHKALYFSTREGKEWKLKITGQIWKRELMENSAS